MSKGIRVPVGLDISGRIAWVDKDEAAIQIIGLNLADNDSDHAFQQTIGLLQSSTFALEGAHRAETLSRVFALFDDFERKKKFKLIRESIRWVKVPGGEEILEFDFLNMESDSANVLHFRQDVGVLSRG